LDCPISSICIPSSVQTLARNYFSQCRSLSTVTFESDSDVSSTERCISRSAFANCSSLSSVRLKKECHLNGCLEQNWIRKSRSTVPFKREVREAARVECLDIGRDENFPQSSVLQLADCIGRMRNRLPRNTKLWMSKLSEVRIPKALQQLSRYCV
jgi:hypothetical protein